MDFNFSQKNFIPKKNYQYFNLPGIQKSHQKIEAEYNNNNMFEQFFKEEKEDKENEDSIENILGFSSNKDESNGDNNDDDHDSIYFTKTNFKTEPKKKFFEFKKVKKVFSIQKKEKIGRKKGRLPLNHRPLNTPKHNRNSLDNIATKIKVHFVKKTLKYINKKYNEFLLQKNRKKKTLLMNIKPNSYNKFSKKANKEFLRLNIQQLFSADLTSRITGFQKDYNRTQIKSLFEKNEATEVINIMNSSVKEMYENYSSNKIADYNLESDLKAISGINKEVESNDEKQEDPGSNNDEEFEEEEEDDEKDGEEGEEENEEGIEEGSENDDKEAKGEKEETDYKDKYKDVAEKLIVLLEGKIKRKNL